MARSKDGVIVMLLVVIAVLLVLNIIAVRFENSIAIAGGGHSDDSGWIAFSGQKNDGPENVYVLNTKRGASRKTGDYEWFDNGPRLAVYRINSQGKIKLTSMRNVGPDVDEWVDGFYADSSGPSVRDVKRQNYASRNRKENGEDEDDENSDADSMPTDDK